MSTLGSGGTVHDCLAWNSVRQHILMTDSTINNSPQKMPDEGTVWIANKSGEDCWNYDHLPQYQSKVENSFEYRDHYTNSLYILTSSSPGI